MASRTRRDGVIVPEWYAAFSFDEVCDPLNLVVGQLLTPAQDARADMLFLTQSQLFETLPNPFPSFIDTRHPLPRTNHSQRNPVSPVYD